MGKGSKQARWIIAIGALVLVAVLLRSSFRATHLQYEVCMDFRGATHCATANGSTAADAIQSARQIDCQLLSDGREQNMACLDQQPSRVRELK
ncbi:MAG TPA: hypothetical protein VN661_08985 [Candidatus Acidoferrales bacterium]|nr:hypothetical protein [Candidatus Acidoferrales bacterium]